VTLAVAHYADLARPRFFAALVVLLCLALLSHPGTFVLTLALVPLLALALAATAGRGGDRRGALALLAALGVACTVVYALYYRHFTGLVGEQIRSWLADTSAVSDAPTDRGWEDDYIRNRLFTLPFAAYFAAAWVAGVALLRRARRAEPGDEGEGDAPSRGGRRALGWLLIAILTTASLFAAAHVLTGVWVRYFVFTTPALAIGAALVVAWLTLRGRWGKALAYAALAYCTAATFLFWLSVTAGSARSPYPSSPAGHGDRRPVTPTAAGSSQRPSGHSHWIHFSNGPGDRGVADRGYRRRSHHGTVTSSRAGRRVGAR